jgi:Protein of unknown function (DUF3592)
MLNPREGPGIAIIVRIVYMIPAAVAYLLVNIARRFHRWYITGPAQSWPAAEASVNSSYQIDENQTAFSLNAWDPDDNDDKYHARWAVALEYTYHAQAEIYSGVYFLPRTYTEGDQASEAAQAWIGRTIVVRYNPSRPQRSLFLEGDGAPGKPHIPWLLSYRPYLTNLSLK